MTGVNVRESRWQFRVATARLGTVGPLVDVGDSSGWEKVARAGDSLLFYEDDGDPPQRAYSATLVNGHYTNVGPVVPVPAGITLIEGGV
ncbi:hypothetical protein [Streptomyces sp. NPDC051183]|uniref:hypothetical protein n=1 Tax=Streptomyces sp. NPDC051183 TaxID=3155165 RepID=UPI00341B5346